MKTTNNSKRTRLIIILVCSLLLIGGIIFILEKKHIINLYGKEPGDNDPGTTSQVETAQSNYSNGGQREAGSADNDDTGSVGVTDTGGSDATTDSSNPIISNSGEITVYSPGSNVLIKPGQILSGTSKLNTVSYRLIDDVSGVIATGSLSVVDGRFSAKISFSTGATTGRIDVFGAKADGVEYSNIEIPIRFK